MYIDVWYYRNKDRMGRVTQLECVGLIVIVRQQREDITTVPVKLKQCMQLYCMYMYMYMLATLPIHVHA